MPRRKRDKHGIFDRGDGWLYIQHKGRRVSLKTQDREQARRNAEAYKRKAADPAHQTADVKRLDEACVEFREHAETGDNRRKAPAPGTFEMYDTHFGHFVRVFGADAVMGDIDAPAVDAYIAQRRKERIGKPPPEGQPDTRRCVSASTVNKELTTLRQVLSLGLRRGWYHLPLERVLPDSAGGVYVPLTRHLTEDQVPLLLAELAKSELSDDPEGRAMTCAYIIATGADWCAVERAERYDFGTETTCARMVLIRGTKNSKRWAEVPIVGALFGELADQVRRYLLKRGRFPKWGKQRSRDLTAACRRAGVPRVTPRDLRRTFGKILAANDIDPHLIGGMMRHGDSRMAELVYAPPEREHVGTQVAARVRRVG
jgi:integrase